jgi:hypothetical protein
MTRRIETSDKEIIMIELKNRFDPSTTSSQDRQAAVRRRRDERQRNLPESFRKRLAEYDEAEKAIHVRNTRQREALGLS